MSLLKIAGKLGKAALVLDGAKIALRAGKALVREIKGRKAEPEKMEE